jgi:hypothetical protein
MRSPVCTPGPEGEVEEDEYEQDDFVSFDDDELKAGTPVFRWPRSTNSGGPGSR